MPRGKSGLGRGLGALLGSDIETTDEKPVLLPQEDKNTDAVLSLRLSDIDPNPDQPRKAFDDEALAELAASIRSVGVIQPVVVWQNGDRYTLISGERRWRASRLAGLREIPAIVRQWDDIKRLEASLIENLQRSDLNPIDEAAGIASLMEQCGLTQENAAERLGKSRPAVANSLRLLTLPEEIRELLKNGTLSAGHARCLVPLGTERQLELAKMAVEFGWSVRRLEQECARNPASEQTEKPKNESTPELRHLERMARDVFGTKAVITGSEQSGKLTIPYKSADDLQRIYELLEAVQQNGG